MQRNGLPLRLQCPSRHRCELAVNNINMKLSNRYVLREVGGKGVLMPEKVTDPSLRTASGALRAITLSGSAFWLLKSFEGREFSLGDAVDAVCGHYEADRATVEDDISSLIDALRTCGALED